MHFGIPPAVLAPVGLIGGVLAAAWAVIAYRAQRRFLRRALQAIGVVQSVRAERLQRTTIYFPVIQFTTDSGAIVTTESKTSRSGLFIGQKIAVLYDPNDPKNVEINSFWSRWVLVWIAAFVAVLLLGSGRLPWSRWPLRSDARPVSGRRSTKRHSGPRHPRGDTSVCAG